MATDAPPAGAATHVPHDAAAALAGPSHVPLAPPMAAAPTLAATASQAAARLARDGVLAAVAARQRARAVAVPTDDGTVRALLRRVGQPVTLFGEREAERRARARDLLAHMDADAAGALVAVDSVDAAVVAAEGAPDARRAERFFTEGPPELAAARLAVAEWSLKHASARLGAARAERARLGEAGAAAVADAAAAAASALARRAALLTSEVGDTRPLAAVAVRAGGGHAATGGWSGAVRVWALPGSTPVGAPFLGHTDRVTGVAWRPGGPGPGEEEESASATLASASVDRTVRLWSPAGGAVAVLAGATDRLARVAWHPAGRLVGAASFDGAWRLWDAETGACLLEQDGHAGAVYALAFHPDGSLAISGGLDGHARVWDARTGRGVLALAGHFGAVLGAAAAPDGVTLATASDDGTARLWDLRAKAARAVLPGHTGLVAAAAFAGPSGSLLATAGYDGGVRLWCARSGGLVRGLDSGGARLGDIDAADAGAGLLLATAGHDRTLKLWGVVGAE